MLKFILKYKNYFLFLAYLILVVSFFKFISYELNIQDYKTIPYLNIINYLDGKINTNIFNLTLYFFIFSIIWILLLGFISPLLILCGFFLNPYLATIVVSFANALSGSILFYLSKTYFKKQILNRIPKKINVVINFINKNLIIYFFIFRLLGGFGIPSQLQNILPALTKINLIQYFYISFIGCLPIMYLTTSIGYSIKYLGSINSFEISILKETNFIIFVTLFVSILLLFQYYKKKLK